MVAQRRNGTSKTYSLDHVFGEQASTLQVYKHTTQPLINRVIEGFNCTVFAYGQTSSGKTHTMRGNNQEPGVIGNAVKDLFQSITSQSQRQFFIRVSYMEVRPGGTLQGPVRTAVVARHTALLPAHGCPACWAHIALADHDSHSWWLLLVFRTTLLYFRGLARLTGAPCARGAAQSEANVATGTHAQADLVLEQPLRSSGLQLYNEEVNDLIDADNTKLQIKDEGENGTTVSGLKESVVTSPEQVLSIMEQGDAQRHVGETKMNEQSSRSHTIFKMVRPGSYYAAPLPPPGRPSPLPPPGRPFLPSSSLRTLHQASGVCRRCAHDASDTVVGPGFTC